MTSFFEYLLHDLFLCIWKLFIISIHAYNLWISLLVIPFHLFLHLLLLIYYFFFLSHRIMIKEIPMHRRQSFLLSEEAKKKKEEEEDLSLII